MYKIEIYLSLDAFSDLTSVIIVTELLHKEKL